MVENADEIELKIIYQLNNFFEEVKQNNYLGDAIWTKRLKEIIGDLGLDLGYQVCCEGFLDKFEKEWLYDVVWYVEDDEKRLKKIPLIVESEWDKRYSAIKLDFEKLLLGNSERRLMICQAKSHEIDSLFEKFAKAINAFQENYGDRFLIAILDSDSLEEFYYKIIIK